MRRASVEDAGWINASHLKHMGEEADFTGFLSNDLNICLVAGECWAMFAWRGPGIYELHLCFKRRGADAKDLLTEMLEAVPADRMWTAIPVEARNVIMFARLMGWKSRGAVELPHGRCQLFISENSPCHL